MKQNKILPKPFDLRFACLACVIIIAFGFIAYFNSFNGKFLYDDRVLVENNLSIKNLSNIGDYFTKDLLAGAGGNSDFYRPMQTLSYAIDYAMAGLDVRAYHVTNTLLHVLTALCIFWFIQTLFQKPILACFAAILFVVHPIHTEAVSYISGRADSLVSIFLLLSMTIYVKLTEQSRFDIVGFIVLLVTYTAALLSKEYSLILPALLLLYHLVFGKRIKPFIFVAVLVLISLYLFIRIICLPSTMPSTHGTDNVFDRLPGVLVALFTYLKLFFLPFPLHMEYGSKLFSWIDPRAITGLLMMVGILTATFLNKANKIILFAVGWFFITLLPVSNLFKINAYMAEHFVYLPSFGFFLIMAYALSILYEHKNKIMALILLSGALVFLLILTIKQNHYWSDPLTFYTMTVAMAPDSSNAYDNLGEIYQKQGKTNEARADYSKAIELDPNNASAYSNLGNIYLNQSQDDQAIIEFDKAIAINPNFAEALCNRGNAYNDKGDYDQAIEDLNRAIALNPHLMQAYFNRGNAYGGKNNLDQAIADLSQAIEFDPSYSEASLNRGIAETKKGDFDLAMADINKAIDLKSNNPEGYFNRAMVYNTKGDLDHALLDYGKAIQLKPDYALAYSNRAVIYFSKGNVDSAIADLSQAIAIRPDFADAYSNRGYIYNNKGNFAKAVADLSHAIQIQPQNIQAITNRAMAYYNNKEYDKSWSDVHKAQDLGGRIDPKFLEALKTASGG